MSKLHMDANSWNIFAKVLSLLFSRFGVKTGDNFYIWQSNAQNEIFVHFSSILMVFHLKTKS